MKLIKLTVLISVISAIVLYASFTETITYNDGAGSSVSPTFTATDTVYSQTFKLTDNKEINLITNLTGTGATGNYINNDIQGLVNATWVTIATDSAGVGYSNYTLRATGTITIPTNTIRLRTRRYRASSTLVANQELNGF